jgi:hypothetical protein
MLEMLILLSILKGLSLEYPKWCLQIMISDHVPHHSDFGLSER